jgi:predicted O-methyltransferase YrrM
MESSVAQKLAFAIKKSLANPRASISWLVRGHMARDEVFVSHSYWFTGSLRRVPLNQIVDGIGDREVQLPRALDRKAGKTAAISVEEACNLAALAKWKSGGKALEIGTSDGNTALLLAANLGPDGRVVTVDLPPDFSLDKQDLLAYPEGDFNLTPRDLLGRQYRSHPLASQIRQVCGDSAKIDWSDLGGPFDLVFIDGSHTDEYVRSDSEHALKHLAPGGVILWHDYGMIRAVSDVVDGFAREHPGLNTYAIEGTRLALALSHFAVPGKSPC